MPRSGAERGFYSRRREAPPRGATGGFLGEITNVGTMTSATSRNLLNAHERPATDWPVKRSTRPQRARRRCPKKKIPPTTTLSFLLLIGNQVPKAEAVYFSRAARRDDDTSTVLSTAVTNPEAEERGAKATSHFSATGSKPTGPSAPSRPTLLCLGHEVPT